MILSVVGRNNVLPRTKREALPKERTGDGIQYHQYIR